MRRSSVAIPFAMFVVLGFGLACSAGDTCTIGATKCENNTLSVCGADSSWQTTMECPAGSACGETAGVASCVPDADGGGGKAGKRKGGKSE